MPNPPRCCRGRLGGGWRLRRAVHLAPRCPRRSGGFSGGEAAQPPPAERRLREAQGLPWRPPPRRTRRGAALHLAAGAEAGSAGGTGAGLHPGRSGPRGSASASSSSSRPAAAAAAPPPQRGGEKRRPPGKETPARWGGGGGRRGCAPAAILNRLSGAEVGGSGGAPGPGAAEAVGWSRGAERAGERWALTGGGRSEEGGRSFAAGRLQQPVLRYCQW